MPRTTFEGVPPPLHSTASVTSVGTAAIASTARHRVEDHPDPQPATDEATAASAAPR